MLFSAGHVERIGNILKITYTKQTTVTLDDLIEITAIRKVLFGEQKYCSMIDLRKDYLSLSPEAKKYAAESPVIRRLRIAEVLLVKNFAQRLGVHTYVRIFRSKDNIRVMTDETEAIEWLNEQYAQNFRKEAI